MLALLPLSLPYSPPSNFSVSQHLPWLAMSLTRAFQGDAVLHVHPVWLAQSSRLLLGLLLTLWYEQKLKSFAREGSYAVLYISYVIISCH